MIHYHGTPIWPNDAAAKVYPNAHLFICHLHLDQFGLALECAASIAVDNGAFPAWRNGKPITDWEPYYEWVAEIHRYPQFDFAVIPDVIDGDEAANDALIEAWPWKDTARHVGAPVWHMHESIERLQRLALAWPRICIGSSGEFAVVGNAKWWGRMAQAMDAICDKHGRPVCKVHGLRMLNPAIYQHLPLASADSTNVARNIIIDQKWKGTYLPVNRAARAIVLRERIESAQAATFWAPSFARAKSMGVSVEEYELYGDLL